MRFTLFALLALLGTMLAGVPIQAHHGYSAFERENTITIEGSIEEIKYMNPHSILMVKTTDSRMYIVEWLSPRSFAGPASITTRCKKAITWSSSALLRAIPLCLRCP